MGRRSDHENLMHVPPLAVFDWTADVVVPVVLSLTVGALLSIWTGLIAGRYLECKEALREALEIFMSPDHLFIKEEDARTVASNNLLRLQAKIGRVFNDQGQLEMQRVFEALCEKMEVANAALLAGVAAAGENKPAKTAAFAQYLQIAEPILKEWKRVRVGLPALILGRKLNCWCLLGRYHAEVWQEHLDTGRPAHEIHARRNKKN
jgi:hypothetical protein